MSNYKTKTIVVIAKLSIIKLILVIGSAVISPLAAQVNYNKSSIDNLTAEVKQQLRATIKLQSLDSIDKQLVTQNLNTALQLSDSLEQITYTHHDFDNWYKCIDIHRRALKGKGEINEAIDYLLSKEKILPDSASLIHGKLSFSLARDFMLTNQLYSSSKYGLKACELLKKNYPNQREPNLHKYLATAYENLALIYTRMQDHNTSIKINKEGLLNCHDVPNIKCYILSNLGKAYFHNNDKKCFSIYKEVIDSCDNNIDAYLYLAEAHFDNKNIDSAQIYSNEYQSRSNYLSHAFHELMANIAEAKKDTIAAEKARKSAVSQARKFGLREHLKSQSQLATFLWKNNRDSISVFEANKTLQLLDPSIDTTDLYSRYQFPDDFLDLWIVDALLIKSKYFIQKYKNDGSLKALTESRYYIQNIFDQLNKIKDSYLTNSSQYSLGEFSQDLYSEIIDFYSEEYIKTGNQQFYEDAFLAAQISNSFVLKNIISKKDILTLAGVSSDSMHTYLNLLQTMSNKVVNEEKSASIKALLDYKEQLLLTYPKIKLIDQETELNVTELQEQLEPNSILLKYFYHPTNKFTLFSISKKEHYIHHFENDDLLQSSIEKTNKYSSNSYSEDNTIDGQQEYMSSSWYVYKTILKPILDRHNKSINHLIIVPDGPIRNISFSALAVKKANSWDSVDNLLLSTFNTSYLYYTGQIKQGKSLVNSADFVGFGIEYNYDYLDEIVENYQIPYNKNSTVQKTRNISLAPLKYADDEANQIAGLLDGASFTNSEVTLSKVIDVLKSSPLVHMSLHSLVDESQYLNSFLLLNEGKGDVFGLSYKNILSLNLDNEFIGLSACQTNYGAIQDSEGTMSLSRAFIQSGCKSTLGAYWNTPDQSTLEIMKLFYTNLQKGMYKSEALKLAQIEYLSNDNLSTPAIRSPFFWASWAIYGLDHPIAERPSNKKYIFVGLCFLVLIGYFLSRKKTKPYPS